MFDSNGNPIRNIQITTTGALVLLEELP